MKPGSAAMLAFLGVVIAVGAGASYLQRTVRAEDTPPRYEMACDSSDTDARSALFCVRADRETGEAVLVDLNAVETGDGSAPTAPSGEAVAGPFQVVCDSTTTAQRASFHCFRLNQRTGTVVRLSIPHLRRLPSDHP